MTVAPSSSSRGYFFCITFLAVGTRIATRWSISRKLEGDDIVSVIALIFSSAQTGAVTETITNGLGRAIGTLSTSQINSFQQSIYAANMLYIVTLYCAKAAVLLLVTQLTPDSLHMKVAYLIGAIISLWAITSVFATAFQCHQPQWQFIGNQCFDIPAFWDYFEYFNLTSDFVLIVFPIMVLGKVNIPLIRKVAVSSCFASRVLVMVAAILRVVYGLQGYNSTDPTLNLWQETLCAQAVQNLSVIVTCVPYLKPFYLGLESGMIRTDDLRRHGRVGSYGYGTSKSGGFPSNESSPNPEGSEKSSSRFFNKRVSLPHRLSLPFITGTGQFDISRATTNETGRPVLIADLEALGRPKPVKQSLSWAAGW